MNLNIAKSSNNSFNATLEVSGILITGARSETAPGAIEALADMFIGWTEEMQVTLPAHKGWLSIAAALKAKVALSENPDQSDAS